MARFAAFVFIGLGSASPYMRQQSTAPIFNVPDSAWSSLNSSVSGRLHAGTPYALPCFDSYQSALETAGNGRDLTTCQNIQKGLATSETLINDFGSYHWPLFGACMARNERCTVNPSTPISSSNPPQGTCHQGSVPDYYIDSREVQDVQRGLVFAKEHGLPVSVKNTGHDFKGRSSGPNTLAIWYVGCEYPVKSSSRRVLVCGLMMSQQGSQPRAKTRHH